MKKIILSVVFVLLLSGCGKYTKENIIKDFKTKVNKSDNYLMKGTLEIYRNEDLYTYDVESSYAKKDKFKVSLTNKTNNHQQIILKNDSGVYVVTPSLNKSFKFQSKWPYNNSQIYLLQPISNDLSNNSTQLSKKNNQYILTFKANYINDKSLIKQKIYLDKKLNLKKVEVIDNNDDVIMRLTVSKLDMNYHFSKDYFNLEIESNTLNNNKNNNNDKDKQDDSKDKETSIDDSVLYPMYVPVDTYLKSQDVIATTSGNRTILTFDGEKPFTFVQSSLNDFNLDYVNGDPDLIFDTVGAVTDYSLSWISNNHEYYLTSDTMNVDELLLVAQSLSVTAVGK